MSLVAYAASSDEEESEEETPAPPLVKTNCNGTSKTAPQLKPKQFQQNIGHISDDDDEFYAPTTSNDTTKTVVESFSLSLPPPIHNTASILSTLAWHNNNNMDDEDNNVDDEDNDNDDDNKDGTAIDLTSKFSKLPTPKQAQTAVAVIEEEDDEFLAKKAIPTEEKPSKPLPVPKKVQISIPSLKDFRDVDIDMANKSKNRNTTNVTQPKASGLLSLLPIAKSEQNFAKNSERPKESEAEPKFTIKPTPTTKPVLTKTHPFIPNVLRTQKPAINTEFVDGVIITPKKNIANKPKPKTSVVECAQENDPSDNESDGEDFFSLNTEQKLPEVSANEISAMVAKRAAKIVETTNKYLNALDEQSNKETDEQEEDEETQFAQAQKRQSEHLNSEAMDALVGRKRRRKQEAIEVIDISGAQVMPDREEWMRTTLASSTAYQATGVLVDEEPAAGTRRKHQITYLAHKAKANEAELQAMWSANRHNRRATQSKYGF